MSNRVVVPARQAGNRFLGSLKGLQIRALDLWQKEKVVEVQIVKKFIGPATQGGWGGG
jgi:hypothetical protein